MGRAPEAEIHLSNPAVSVHHARLAFDADGRGAVTDLGSRHGTLLNGRRLTAGEAVGVASGDVLEVGPHTIELRLEAGGGLTTDSRDDDALRSALEGAVQRRHAVATPQPPQAAPSPSEPNDLLVRVSLALAVVGLVATVGALTWAALGG